MTRAQRDDTACVDAILACQYLLVVYPFFVFFVFSHPTFPRTWRRAIPRKTGAAHRGKEATESALVNSVLMDQSSVVIGQRGFRQRGKKKSLLKTSGRSRSHGFSEDLTFAVLWGDLCANCCCM